MARAPLAVAVLIAAAGCGGGRPPLSPVTGAVLVKGKPADGAFVVFHPTTDAPDAPRPSAVTGPDGAFALTTYAAGDGAPPGDYKVTVVWRPRKKTVMDADGPDRLGNRYADPAAARFTAAVGSGPTSLPPFEAE